MRRYRRGNVMISSGQLREESSTKPPEKPRESVNFDARSIADWSAEEDIEMAYLEPEEPLRSGDNALDRSVEGRVLKFDLINRIKPVQLPAGSNWNMYNLCFSSDVTSIELRDDQKFIAGYKDGTAATIENCGPEAFGVFYEQNKASSSLSILSLNISASGWDCEKKGLRSFLRSCSHFIFCGEFHPSALEHILAAVPADARMRVKFSNWYLAGAGSLKSLLRSFPTLRFSWLTFDATVTDETCFVSTVVALWQSSFKCQYLSMTVSDWEELLAVKINLIRVRSMAAEEAVIFTQAHMNDLFYHDLLGLKFAYAGTRLRKRGEFCEKYHLMSWVGEIRIVIAFQASDKQSGPNNKCGSIISQQSDANSLTGLHNVPQQAVCENGTFEVQFDDPIIERNGLKLKAIEIKLNNLKRGVLHSLVRHFEEFKQCVPDLDVSFLDPDEQKLFRKCQSTKKSKSYAALTAFEPIHKKYQQHFTNLEQMLAGWLRRSCRNGIIWELL